MTHHGSFNNDNHASINAGYERFCHFLNENYGISLSDNKHYLVESRLRSILTDQGLSSVDALLDFMEFSENKYLAEQVVDAMTTNETFWFRDFSFFQYFRHKLIPSFIENANGHAVDIWSAACSSGQEAYSTSIIIEECLRDYLNQEKNVLLPQFNILGTDISSCMIKQAQEAIYSAMELSRGLPISCEKYFEYQGKNARLLENISGRVNFQKHNLLESFNHFGMFDVILCRNVLIYFDGDTIEEILRRMHDALKPGGYLFLSAAESIAGLKDIYSIEPASCGFCYRAIK